MAVAALKCSAPCTALLYVEYSCELVHGRLTLGEEDLMSEVTTAILPLHAFNMQFSILSAVIFHLLSISDILGATLQSRAALISFAILNKLCAINAFHRVVGICCAVWGIQSGSAAAGHLCRCTGARRHLRNRQVPEGCLTAEALRARGRLG